MQKTSVLEELCDSLYILSICQRFFEKCKNGLKFSNIAVILLIYDAQTHLINWGQPGINPEIL